jgi:hypothetical protein
LRSPDKGARHALVRRAFRASEIRRDWPQDGNLDICFSQLL